MDEAVHPKPYHLDSLSIALSDFKTAFVLVLAAIKMKTLIFRKARKEISFTSFAVCMLVKRQESQTDILSCAL